MVDRNTGYKAHEYGTHKLTCLASRAQLASATIAMLPSFIEQFLGVEALETWIPDEYRNDVYYTFHFDANGFWTGEWDSPDDEQWRQECDDDEDHPAKYLFIGMSELDKGTTPGEGKSPFARPNLAKEGHTTATATPGIQSQDDTSFQEDASVQTGGTYGTEATGITAPNAPRPQQQQAANQPSDALTNPTLADTPMPDSPRPSSPPHRGKDDDNSSIVSNITDSSMLTAPFTTGKVQVHNIDEDDDGTDDDSFVSWKTAIGDTHQTLLDSMDTRQPGAATTRGDGDSLGTVETGQQYGSRAGQFKTTGLYDTVNDTEADTHRDEETTAMDDTDDLPPATNEDSTVEIMELSSPQRARSPTQAPDGTPRKRSRSGRRTHRDHQSPQTQPTHLAKNAHTPQRNKQSKRDGPYSKGNKDPAT